MLKYLCCLLVLLPAATIAEPASTGISAVPGPTPPPPPPIITTQMPRGTGHPHACADNYPDIARHEGAEGTTLLGFTVTAQGTLADITVTKSSGDADLDAAAVTCASAWTYKPATNNGAPVDVPWQANVIWKLNLPLIPAAPFQSCTKFATVTPEMLSGIGQTRVAFLLMPDGSAKPTGIIASSGNATLDQAAAQCIGARHYDVSQRKLPPEGMPQHEMVDWKQELAAQ